MIDIAVRDLVKEYEVGQPVLNGLTFQVDTGERVGILGRNGAGKTTLFRILTGQEEADSGQVIIPAGKRLGLISQIPVYPAGYTVEDVLRTAFDDLKAMEQEMEALSDQLAGGDAQLLAQYDRLQAAYETGGGYEIETRLEKICSGLGISKDFRAKDFAQLSGGEQSRLRLCMLMDEKVNFLILDEPTNHLDLDSREWIEEAVEEYEGALLFVSHDRYFIDRFATRIWTLENGVITDFKGDYAAYQAWRERQKQLAPPPKPPKEEKVKKERPKRTGGTKQLKKDLAAAEKRMEKLDQLMETLNAEKEAAASDYQKLQELAEQEAEYTAEYDALMEKWEVLSEAIAAEEG